MGIISKDIGIDLGTSNIRIHLKGKGVVLSEPAVVAINQITGEILAVGNQAKEMIGRTPDSIVAFKPLKDGVIADFESTRALMQNLISRVVQKSLFYRPRIVVSIPSGITDVEERAVEGVVYKSGAKEVYLMEEVKKQIGAATAAMTEDRMEVKGRNLLTGLPETITVTTEDINEAMKDSLNEILRIIKLTLEQTPPELASDIMERGITLSGGLSLLRNIDRLISDETGMPVFIADEPEKCVVKGVGMALDNIEVLKKATKTRK